MQFFLKFILFLFFLINIPYSCLSQFCNSSEVVENLNEIEGYLDKESYFPGDTIRAKTHCLTPSFEIKIMKLGLVNDTLYIENGYSSIQQNYPYCAFQDGCNWQTTFEFIIPNDWTSGYYNLTIKQEESSEKAFIPFILKNKTNFLHEGLLVIAGTNTWQAYNNWGGKSYYTNSLDSINTKIISFDRPFKTNYFDPESKSKANGPTELYLIKFLELNNISYQVISDRDLDELNDLDIHYPVILHLHPEYYTIRMFDNLQSLVNRGGKLIYAGGNGIYFKSVYSNRQMESRQVGSIHQLDGSPGGRMRDAYSPESHLLGVEYTGDGYNTYAAYSVKMANHWVFENTGLNNEDSVGYIGECFGQASGKEMDKRSESSPMNTILLAKGKNPNNSGAEMTYYKNSNCGEVFSVGSLVFCGSLLVDPYTPKILQNVINRFIANSKLDTNINIISCDSYIAPDSQIYSQSGIYTSIIPSSQACDSIITINLTIKNQTFSTLNVTECTSFTAPDGQIYTSSGIYAAILPNATGCDSIITINLTIGTTSTINEFACETYTAPDGQIYTQSGIYTSILPNANGCDSVITLNLSLTIVNTAVLQTGSTLTSVSDANLFQWINCSNNQAMNGETNQSYTPSQAGNYALIVEAGGCTDTSICFAVGNLALAENISNDKLLVYPNPTHDLLNIEFLTNESFEIKILDLKGKILLTKNNNFEKTTLNVNSLLKGIYLLELTNQEQRFIRRFSLM
jgi:N,N-dimethylformamidase